MINKVILGVKINFEHARKTPSKYLYKTYVILISHTKLKMIRDTL